MEFHIKNPNNSLITYGVINIVLGFILYLAAPALFLAYSLIIKILVLLWIPKAASLAGRNTTAWTIFCFIVPSIGIITLGGMGYNKVPDYLRIIKECTNWLNEYSQKLTSQVEKGEIEEPEKEELLNDYLSDLKDFAEKQLSKIYNSEDNNFLTEQLERKGYVLNNESDVFVDYSDACPACGMKLKENDKICPDCGLNLYPD
jgi:rRNA maturation endonuclease Nob1